MDLGGNGWLLCNFLRIHIARHRGDGRALFATGVSVLFAVMFFATAAVLASIKGRELPSPLSRGQDLQTLTGPMGLPAVVGQVLAIPVALVIFSIAIALITWGVR